MLKSSIAKAFRPAQAFLEVTSWHDEPRTVIKVPSSMFLDLWVHHVNETDLRFADGVNAVLGVFNDSNELKALVVPSFATLDRLSDSFSEWNSDCLFVDLFFPEDEREAARFGLVVNEDGSFYVTADGERKNAE